MDIQEMVDRRIAELESEPVAATRVRPAGEKGSFSPAAAQELKEFGRTMDAALSRVAAGVLEISEKISWEHSRMERSILKSRLEALEAIESVLDITLRLRSETARRLSAFNNKLDDGPGGQALSLAEPQVAGSNHRSSMRDGMTALFKRTI